jgi:hypothetical protein
MIVNSFGRYLSRTVHDHGSCPECASNRVAALADKTGVIRSWVPAIAGRGPRQLRRRRPAADHHGRADPGTRPAAHPARERPESPFPGGSGHPGAFGAPRDTQASQLPRSSPIPGTDAAPDTPAAMPGGTRAAPGRQDTTSGPDPGPAAPGPPPPRTRPHPQAPHVTPAPHPRTTAQRTHTEKAAPRASWGRGHTRARSWTPTSGARATHALIGGAGGRDPGWLADT